MFGSSEKSSHRLQRDLGTESADACRNSRPDQLRRNVEGLNILGRASVEHRMDEGVTVHIHQRRSYLTNPIHTYTRTMPTTTAEVRNYTDKLLLISNAR